VSVYKIDLNYNVKPFLSELMNATGLAFDGDGQLYVSSRYDGIVYQVTPGGTMSVYVEGMGVATGIAFDGEGNLYVGDRSGTIFKISRDRQIYVFATIEPSIAAYHLAFGADGHLYVTGPTTSSFDAVHRISPPVRPRFLPRAGLSQASPSTRTEICTLRRWRAQGRIESTRAARGVVLPGRASSVWRSRLPARFVVATSGALAGRCRNQGKPHK
jgi:hypothetical protein